MDTAKNIVECGICRRQHQLNEYCPRRLARVMVSFNHSYLSAITKADKIHLNNTFPSTDPLRLENLVECLFANPSWLEEMLGDFDQEYHSYHNPSPPDNDYCPEPEDGYESFLCTDRPVPEN